ncbi:MAG: SDR family NAD(P)-dependent oxidoreductase [Novosphingobium sp.]|nr:SDR family NAD(P)-dependent oxidoreductase [Novosphingobium sp.]
MAKGDICLTGIGCRLPGGVRDVAGLSRFLFDKGDGIVDLHDRRWNADRFYDPTPGRLFRTASRWGGLIDGIDMFDAEFFGMAESEAATLDPQQRILLQVAWEAMADAGLPDDRALRARTGVFVGVSTHDYADGQVARLDAQPPSPFSATGQATSIVANRLSHALDLGGPSVAIDTACSSSLMALHFAALAIANGDCDVALVAGVNAIIHPQTFIAFSAASMLSPDGRCKAFDASANGFVRAEGAGVVVLRRTADALADGDKIYARLMATGANQNAHTRGMTLPSATAQAALSEMTRRRAGLKVSDISYVEAHGTGTAVGDPIEAEALGQAYGQRRGQPTLIGSVKTNIGHLEAGAGVAGLIKLALAMHDRKVPPNLHFDTPNPAIDFDRLGIRVVTEQTDLGTGDSDIFGAVNSFGFGGANAHAILASPPRTDRAADAGGATEALAPLVISARTEQALRENAARMRDFIAASHPCTQLLRSSALRRQVQHPLRLAVPGEDNNQIVAGLNDFLDGGSTGNAWVRGHAQTRSESGPVFVYSGQGPQWWGMGRQLYRTEPVFRETIEACAREQARFGEWDLLDEFLADEASSRVDNTAIAQPCIFALQAGLTRLLKSQGIEPVAVVGHSVGEVAAAWASGSLDLADACRVIYERGVAMDLSEQGGAMISLGLSAQETMALPEIVNGTLEIAALNGRMATVVAGYESDVAALEARLSAQRVRMRRLPVRYAFHSRLMEPAREPLLGALAGLKPKSGTIPLISTVSGDRIDGEALDAGYWWHNIRRPVRFHRAIAGLVQRGQRAFLEISPHPVLGGEVGNTLREQAKSGEGLAVGTLRRGRNDTIEMQRALGALHGHGMAIGGQAPQSSKDWIRLPTYAWDDRPFWTEAVSSLRSRRAPVPHPLLTIEVPATEPTWRMSIDPRSLPMLNEHLLAGRIVAPGTLYIEMVLAALRASSGAEGCLILSDVHIERALSYAPGGDPVFAQVSLNGNRFRLSSATDVEEGEFRDHVTGRCAVRKTIDPEPVDIAGLRARCTARVDFEDVYRRIRHGGLTLGPQFRCVGECRVADREAIARVKIPEDAREGLSGMILPPALFDALGHIVGSGNATLLPDGTRDMFYAPSRYDEIRVHRPTGCASWCHVRVREHGPFRICLDATFFDESGDVSVEVRGYELLCAAPLSQTTETTPFDRNHRIAWRLDARRSSPDRRWTAAQCSFEGLRSQQRIPSSWLDDLWLAHETEPRSAFIDKWRTALREHPGSAVDLALLAQIAEALPALKCDAAASASLVADATTASHLAASLAADPRFAALEVALRDLRAGLPAGRSIRVLDLSLDYGATSRCVLSALGEDGEITCLYSGTPMLRAMTEGSAGSADQVRFVELDALHSGENDEQEAFDIVLCNPQATHHMVDGERLAARFGGEGSILMSRAARPGYFGGLARLQEAALANAVFAASDTGEPSDGWFVGALDPSACACATSTRETAAERSPPNEKLVLVGTAEIVAPITKALDGAARDRTTSVASHGPVLRDQLARLAERDADAPVRIVDVQALACSRQAGSVDEKALRQLEAIQGCAQDIAAALEQGIGVTYTVVTAGAHGGSIAGDDGDPCQSAVLGFVRSVAASLGEADCRMIDLSPEPDARDMAMLASELCGPSDGEDLVALRGSARYVARLVPVGPATVPIGDAPGRMLRLETRAPGLLDKLALADCERIAPMADEVEIEVEAAALNFRDVLKARRLYPADTPDALQFGDECAGRIVRVGSGVTQFAPGDRVIAWSTGSLATHVVTPVDRVTRMPDGIEAAAASGLIVPFVTAYKALVDTARIRRGDTVLIHAGAGGVGLAAIQIAQAFGAQVIATAGSEIKRSFLHALGVEHVFDSRSATFVDGVMAATDGRGVDILLNSLAGDLLQASFDVLAPDAHFIELGKRDIEEDTQIGLRRFRKGASYTALDLSRGTGDGTFADVMQAMSDMLAAGELSALPYRAFGLDKAVDAFATMSRGAHLGKIVLEVGGRDLRVPVQSAPSLSFDAERAYVVTGGLRGLGMQTALWLVKHGARKIALVGRSGSVPAEEQRNLQAMRDAGAEVAIFGADLGGRESVRAVLSDIREKSGPIGGIVHAAATYSDRLLRDETPENLALVFKAKAASAWALHEETIDDPLDLFLMYSSISAVLGSVGQTGYAAANAFLNGLARHRAASGLPATVVDLDPVADAGFLARNEKVANYLKVLGFPGLSSSQVLDSVGIALAGKRTETVVTGLDWTSGSLLAGQGGSMPLLRELVQSAGPESVEGTSVRERILALGPGERVTAARAFLRTEIARILRRPEDQIGDDDLLEEMGIDSLSLVELVLRLETELAVSLPSSLIMMSPSVAAVAKVILHQLTASATESDVDDNTAAPDVGQRLATLETLKGDAALANALDYGLLGVLPGPGAPLASVLVTGATGIVGSALVAELLRNTDAELTCLVRGTDDDEATERLIAAIRQRDRSFSARTIRTRCTIHAADLSVPLFGLPPEVFDAMASDISDIFHLAAEVNHVLPYASLRQANVMATLEIIDFAMCRKVKRIHFASSIAIFNADDEGEDGIIREATVPGNPQALATPYQQTKWVADMLVQHAAAKGLPATIHRIGLVVNEDRNAAFDEGALYWRVLEGAYRIGSIPDMEFPLHLVGSRFAATAMRVVAERAHASVGPYCIVATDGGSLREFSAQLPDMSVMPLENWLKAFAGMGVIEADSPLAPYIQSAASQLGTTNLVDLFLPSLKHVPDRFDRSNLDAAIAGAEIPEFDVQGFLGRAARHLKNAPAPVISRVDV